MQLMHRAVTHSVIYNNKNNIINNSNNIIIIIISYRNTTSTISVKHTKIAKKKIYIYYQQNSTNCL